jgi:hypothetical protein
MSLQLSLKDSLRLACLKGRGASSLDPRCASGWLVRKAGRPVYNFGKVPFTQTSTRYRYRKFKYSTVPKFLLKHFCFIHSIRFLQVPGILIPQEAFRLRCTYQLFLKFILYPPNYPCNINTSSPSRRLEQIPLVAIQVIEHSHQPIRLLARGLGGAHAVGLHVAVVFPKIPGVQKQEDPPAGLMTHRGLLLRCGCASR